MFVTRSQRPPRTPRTDTPLPHPTLFRSRRQVEDGGGHQGAGPAIDHRRQFVAIAIIYFLGVVHWVVLALWNERGRYQRRPDMLDEFQRDPVIGHANAYGLARWVGHPPRHFTGGLQYKRPGARRGHLEKTVLTIIHPCKMTDLGQIAAQDRKRTRINSSH